MHALKQLRIAATTVAATTTGLLRIASARRGPARVLLAPGDPAPDFELPGSDGLIHRLADSRGREAIVIAWFPKAFTGGCTAECESIARSTASFGQFPVKVFGASVDRVETNRRFAASVGAEFPILSDVDGRVARAYGVLGASGFPSRWTFYIGLDGIIVDVDRRVQTATHGDTIAARLAGIVGPRRT